MAEIHAMSSAEYEGWGIYFGRLRQRQEIAAAKAKGRRTAGVQQPRRVGRRR